MASSEDPFKRALSPSGSDPSQMFQAQEPLVKAKRVRPRMSVGPTFVGDIQPVNEAEVFDRRTLRILKQENRVLQPDRRFVQSRGTARTSHQIFTKQQQKSAA